MTKFSLFIHWKKEKLTQHPESYYVTINTTLIGSQAVAEKSPGGVVCDRARFSFF